MDIFTFKNYRDFLRSFLAHLPNKGRGERTRLAQHLRMSNTLLSQILSGKRNFSLDHAHDLIEYLQLSEIEAEYFNVLIQLELTDTQRAKASLRKKLERLRNESLKLSKQVRFEKSLNEKERAEFYSSWLYAAAHLYLTTDERGIPVDQIAQRFQISRPKALGLMQFLMQTRLAEENGGHYKAGIQSTFVEQGSPHLLKHHSNWRLKALQRSESLSDKELMFSAPISLSEKDFAVIREKAANFIREISKIVKESKPEIIANFNMDWFYL